MVSSRVLVSAACRSSRVQTAGLLEPSCVSLDPHRQADGVLMAAGFGLLESGCVSLKNEVNIMVKNAVDVILGGLSYWVFGYGLSFGTAYSNILFAAGDFAVSSAEQVQNDV